MNLFVNFVIIHNGIKRDKDIMRFNELIIIIIILPTLEFWELQVNIYLYKYGLRGRIIWTVSFIWKIYCTRRVTGHDIQVTANGIWQDVILTQVINLIGEIIAWPLFLQSIYILTQVIRKKKYSALHTHMIGGCNK